MAIFDTLIDDMAQRFGLGANAGPLVREGLTLITGVTGGIGGFLEPLQVGWAFLGRRVLARQVGRGAPGRPADRKSAGRQRDRQHRHPLGLGQAAVSSALGYGIPKIVGLLTPNGVIPTSLPAEVTKFISAAPHRAGRPEQHSRPPRVAEPAARVAPKKVEVYAETKKEGLPGWLWPLLAALVLFCGWWLWPRPVAEAPVAQAPPVATPRSRGRDAAPVATPAPVPAPAPAPAPCPDPHARQRERRRSLRRRRFTTIRPATSSSMR